MIRAIFNKDVAMSKNLKMSLFITLLVLVFGGLIAFNLVRNYFIEQFKKNYRPAPVTISTSVAKAVNYQPRLSAVGSVLAINGVTISPELAGVVQKINFNSGDLVQAGQSLVQMDTDLDVQDLKNDEAKLNLNQLDFQRKKRLYGTGAISVSDYDLALSQLQQIEAMVAKDQVVIAKKDIKAPFAGKLGIRRVNLGQYLNPGDAIVSLQQIDPLFVNFSLPQQYFPQLKIGEKVALKVDLYPGQEFDGSITAINSQVTQQTRNIDIQATVSNTDAKLYPGIFANVSVFLPGNQAVVTVPNTAVSYSLYGDVVYVITPVAKKNQDKAVYQAQAVQVQAGDSIGNDVIIESGIKAGDVVANSGQLKLENGVQVYVNNEVELNPLAPAQLNGGA